MHSKPTASPLRVHVVNSVLVNNRCSRNRVKHTNTCAGTQQSFNSKAGGTRRGKKKKKKKKVHSIRCHERKEGE